MPLTDWELIVLGAAALVAGGMSGWLLRKPELDDYRDWRGLLAPRHWTDKQVARAAAQILRDREDR